MDSSEQGLFQLRATLADSRFPCKPFFVLGSVTDTSLVNEIFAAHSPGFVFHAAAYKHLALLEEQPLGAIANNALGTRTLAACAARRGAARIVLVSTDKVAEPISILGATKHIAEQITLAHNGIAVRLANVLGTRGSVVESFLHQISAHEAITIRNCDAERYFMTCEEAVDLILAAAIEESCGTVVVPQIHSRHRIDLLAQFLCKAVANEDQPEFVFGALYPGEKVREALWGHKERPTQAASNGYWLLTYTSAHSSLGKLLVRLSDAVEGRNIARALELVVELVPGYEPSSTVTALMQRSVLGVLQQ
jgi:FlaA1/EpsC-like NDP-sugar epimerase